VFLYTHLRNFNVRHFGMAEATILQNVTSRSPSMAVPAYQISPKSTNRFKSISGGDTRQAGWWFDKPTFIYWKLAKTMLKMCTVQTATTAFVCTSFCVKNRWQHNMCVMSRCLRWQGLTSSVLFSTLSYGRVLIGLVNYCANLTASEKVSV
jgi:hypothetical protein